MNGTLLDTFVLLFTSNTDQVVKGADAAGLAQKTLDKHITNTSAHAADLGNSFMNMARQAAGLLATYYSTGFLLHSFFGTAEYVDRLAKFTESIDVNQQEVEAWGYAVQTVGGSAEGFMGTLDNLSIAMTQIDVTGKSRLLPFFRQLGIQMTDTHGKVRPVLDILPELADSFAKIGKQESRSFGQKLGLDESTIMLLQRGRREVDALIARQKELGTVSVKDTEAAKAYTDAIDDQRHVWRILMADIGADVLPILNNLLEKITGFTKVIRGHLGFLYGVLAPVVGVISALSARWAYLKLIGVASIGGLAAPLWVLIGILATVGTAIALIWDDFEKWKQGAPNILGPFYLWLLKIRDILVTLHDFLDDPKTFFKEIGKTALQLGKDALPGGAFAVKAALIQASTPQAQSLVFANRQSSFPGYGTKTVTVKIDKVEVNTNATDANGIARDIGHPLSTSIQQTISNFDDGVKG